MEKDKLWAKFEKTGAVSDYLKYCGVDLPQAENRVEENDETDHRRTDYSPKQQYR